MNKKQVTGYDELPIHGRPIDAVVGDESAHPSVQNKKSKTQAKVETDDVADLNDNALPPDGNLKPGFDGTQPKLMEDGTLRVVTSQQLEEEEADFEDGETSADLTVVELKAALNAAQIEYPSNALKAELVALYDEHIAE